MVDSILTYLPLIIGMTLVLIAVSGQREHDSHFEDPFNDFSGEESEQEDDA